MKKPSKLFNIAYVVMFALSIAASCIDWNKYKHLLILLPAYYLVTWIFLSIKHQQWKKRRERLNREMNSPGVTIFVSKKELDKRAN